MSMSMSMSKGEPGESVGVEKLFLLGPETRLEQGWVSEADAARWRSYLEREGQALLRAPAEPRALINCLQESARVPDGPQPEYLLEYLDPSMVGESLFPEDVTWQLYFRDVHGIFAESTEELVAALEAAGWPEEKVDRFRDVALDGVVAPGSAEDEEYTAKTMEFAAQDDVYTSALECAFGLIREMTAGFAETAPPERIVARLRLFPEEKGVRWAYAVGALSVTALQEMLLAAGTGVRVRFGRPTDPLIWDPLDLNIP